MQPTLRVLEEVRLPRRPRWRFIDPAFGPTWVEAILIASLVSAIVALLVARA